MESLMTSRFRWHASGCDERLHVLLAIRRASWNGRQKPEATFLAAFGTPASSLIKLFTRLGEISVCSLWMYIRRLWMAIRSLWMAIRSLQTEISVGFEDDFCMLLGRMDYAENGIGMLFGKRFFLMDWQSKHNADARNPLFHPQVILSPKILRPAQFPLPGGFWLKHIKVETTHHAAFG